MHSISVGLAEVTATGMGEGDDVEKPYVFWNFTYVKFFRTYYYEYPEFTWTNAPEHLRMNRHVATTCKIHLPVGSLQVIFCTWYKYGCWLIIPYADLTAKDKQRLGDKTSP
ncbi:hypothetical protein Y032_0013g2097 [Ancylostoma ceylanicum]|uniref:Uncharacterized protein n=1 Tax=Ancylostoma ceylanicum TaxID=53326 RepID=A0A016VBE2_9BILA|nr:hypothetical protein Y032_0013g2097 [Ancylostoma ceylanicum]